MNRCFGPPWLDAEGALAEEVLAVILASEPECLVDIHNNTGHNPAYGGLVRLLERDDLALRGANRPMSVLAEPIWVCIAGDMKLAFGDTADPSAELTISADIDRHNFELLPAGAAIGWVQPGSRWPLFAQRPDGSECSHTMFRVVGDVLETSRDFIPIMMTTRPDIAKSDCLFYAVREGGPPDSTPGSSTDPE